MEMKIKSLYICVKDMERAISFYEDFFGQPVTERDDIYSVFDVGGFRFGLFAYRKMNEAHTFGDNCLPSVAFSDVEALKEKLVGRKVVFSLRIIGKNYVTEIEDSEGNHVEMTAPCGAEN